MAADAVTPYWTAVLGLVGIDDIGFIDAEGTDLQPQGKVKAMQSAMQQMRESLLKKNEPAADQLLKIKSTE